VLPRTIAFQRGAKHLVKRRGSVAVATFWTAANHDLEATYHAALSLTGTRRPVNAWSNAGTIDESTDRGPR
jgi:hypothetical protein